MFRWLVLIIIVGMVGCNQTNQELVKDYHNDGMQLFKMGRYSDAQESFQAAQQLQPADPGIYYNLGQTYDYLKRPYDAEKCYKECIVRSPDHAGARHALTVLLMNQNRQDEAVKGIEDWLAKTRTALLPTRKMVGFGKPLVICPEPNLAISRHFLLILPTPELL